MSVASVIESLLQGFERSAFPVEVCTQPNAREPEVRDSVAKYICVLSDDRFPSECRIKVLSPYTCPDLDSGELLLGWVDEYGNYYDHFEKCIHDDHERVVAWLEEHPHAASASQELP